MKPSDKIIRRVASEEVPKFDQWSEGEQRYYAFDGEHVDKGEVKQIEEVCATIERRTGVPADEVRGRLYIVNYRSLGQRGMVLFA